MNDNIMVFHYFEPDKSKKLERRKREPNMFIAFRKEMMKFKPYNMKMTEFSKIVSKKWKNLTKDEKTELQRKYQINRDQKLQNMVNERVTVVNLDMIEGDNLTGCL